MMIGMDIVIGIDPGATCGWAGVTVETNPNLVLFDSVTLPKMGTKKDIPANTPSAVAEALIATLGRFDQTVEVVAIEDQYLSVNPDSMKKLARSAGRWEEAWRRLGVRVEWVNAQVWQSAELGTSRINSEEVKRRCKMKVLGMWKKEVPEHAADAALIARYTAIRLAYRRLRAGR